jgi:hypothetical protein
MNEAIKNRVVSYIGLRNGTVDYQIRQALDSLVSAVKASAKIEAAHELYDNICTIEKNYENDL